MPKRKGVTQASRFNDKAIVALKEIIAQGQPWTESNERRPHGFFDLFGLIRGSFFGFALHYCHEDDEESQERLWQALRDDILGEHIKHAPCTRPWAWWRFDAPETRRVVGIDPMIMGDETDRLPAFEDPTLPEFFRGSYFGKPSIVDGFLYEDEEDYLRRLDLLLPGEEAADNHG